MPSYSDMMKRGAAGMTRGFIAGGIPGALTAGGGEAIKNIADITDQAAYGAGGAVTDLTGSPKAGFAANLATQAVPTVLGGLTGRVVGSGPMESGARSLMTSALKPSTPDVLSGKGPRAVQTLFDEGLNATTGGVRGLYQRAEEIYPQVDEILAKSASESVKKTDAGKRLGDVMQKFKWGTPSDREAIVQAWRDFRNHPDLAGKTDIPVQLAQEAKRGIYGALDSKMYGEMQGAATESQKALARGLKETIAEKVPAVSPLNERLAELLNAKEIAARRAAVSGNANPAGMALITNNPEAAVGFMADKSALVKSLIARLLYSGKETIPFTAGAAAGADYGNRTGVSP